MAISQHSPALATRHAKVAVFNLKRLVGFVNSVAYAHAAQLGTSIGYASFTDNAVMDALISACTHEPGIAEVNQNTMAIELHRKQFARQYLLEALHKAHDGPQDFLAYLAFLEKVKERNLALLTQTFQRVAAIDNNIDNALTKAVYVLATTKAVATITIAATPVGLTAIGAEAALIATASSVAFVYSVTKGAAKHLAEGKDAEVIAFDTGQEIGKEAVSRGAEKLKEHAAEKLSEHADLIAQGRQKIDELTAVLARKVSSRKIAKLQRQIGRAEEALAEAKGLAGKARLTGFAAKGVPVVFAGMDIWGAIKEYQEDVGLRTGT